MMSATSPSLPSSSAKASRPSKLAITPISTASSPASVVSPVTNTFTPTSTTQLSIKPALAASYSGTLSGGSGSSPAPLKSSITSKEWVVPPRPKPGRKPATDTPPTKRKAQNRAAQRAFRERRAARVGELEELLEEQKEDHDRTEQDLRDQVQGLETEMQTFRSRCATLEDLLEKERAERGRLASELEAVQRRWRGEGSDMSSARGSVPSLYGHTMSTTSQQQFPRGSFASIASDHRNSAASFSMPQIVSPPDSSYLSQHNPRGVTDPAGCGNCDSTGPCACVDDALAASVVGCGACSIGTKCACLEAALKLPDGELKRRPSSISALAPEEKRLKSDHYPNEIDFTAMYSKKKEAISEPAVYETPTTQPAVPPRDSCGFCKEGTYCMCAEAAASQTLAPIGSQVQTPPASEDDVGLSPMDVTSTGAIKLPSINSLNRIPVKSSRASRSCGPDGPGTCTQCQKDAKSGLFCRSLAARFAREQGITSGGCCGGGGGSGCCKNGEAPTSSPISTDQNGLGVSLSCADAYKALSSHQNFDKAADEIGTWLPKLKAVPMEASTSGRLPIEVEAASIMGVLKEFDITSYVWVKCSKSAREICRLGQQYGTDHVTFVSLDELRCVGLDWKPEAATVTDQAVAPKTAVGCVICGAAVLGLNHQPPWMGKFQTVYAIGHVMPRAQLSSIGERRPNEDVIPLDYSEEEGRTQRIHLMRSVFGLPGSQFWGFPFHASCWEVMTANCPDDEVHVQAFFDLCRSCPILLGIVDFGHVYGGLLKHEPNPDELCPGEETGLVRQNGEGENVLVSRQSSDPFHNPLLRDIFNGHNSPVGSPATIGLAPQATTTRDPFNRLPPELLQFVFNFLPSVDVLSLKLASRTMANILHADRFWHSRFWRGHEFDYVFESQHYLPQRGNWKQIFFAVHRLRDDASLVNRKRVWKVATTLNDLLGRIAGVPCQGRPVRSYFEPDAAEDGWSCVPARRALKHPERRFGSGCRSLYERSLTLPTEITSITVSAVDMFAGRYVTGIQFQGSDGSCSELGYIHQGSTCFTVPDLNRGSKYLSISGFHLAQDQRGIRGLAVLFATGQLSSWVGEYKDLPRRRLVLVSAGREAGSIPHAIKAGLDACKMVTLSIANDPMIHDEAHNDPNSALPLRDTAVWFPEIPEPGLSFFGVKPSEVPVPRNDRPFGTAIFGDVRGDQLLPRALSFTVWTADETSLLPLALQIEFDKPPDGGRTRVRLGQTEEGMSLLRWDSIKSHHFLLDFAQGEKITAVDTLYSASDRLLSFKIYTNQRRSWQFPPSVSPQNTGDMNLVSLKPENGQVVGFYGTTSRLKGLENLGIVCVGTTSVSRSEMVIRSDGCWKFPTT